MAGLSFQCFNPRPAFWPGATCRRSRRRRSRSVVSILARPFGRALRSPGCTLHRAVSCFNPRPAFWPGATPRLPDPLASLPVSILARPFGRALPAARSRPMEQRPSFQSSPGLLAGRYLEWTASRDRRGCFNPRPAFWPGATGVTTDAGVPAAVFQSSPGLLAGRYSRYHQRESLVARVSILARPFGRALPHRPRLTSKPRRFQSSPGLLAGRYMCRVAVSLSGWQFQSSPGLLAGRYRRAPACRGSSSPSFNPRPAFWPGATPGAHQPRSESVCFNPRPAFWPGATIKTWRTTQTLEVSILARPFGRALRHIGMGIGVRGLVSILARPFGRALRSGDHAGYGRFRVSILARPFGRALRPGLAGLPTPPAVSILARPFGRALLPKLRRLCPGGEVSILARPFGRALQEQIRDAIRQQLVSILARPFGRALLAPPAPPAPPPPVSILARPFGRALPVQPIKASMVVTKFQSSPGLLAGRYRPSQPDWTWPPCFNPRPAFWPGATCPTLTARPSACGFNPRPAFWPGATAGRASKTTRRSGFNPRPAFWPGATLCAVRAIVSGVWFQSSPGLLAGRDGGGQAGPVHVVHVSILARPFGRALRDPPGR